MLLSIVWLFFQLKKIIKLAHKFAQIKEIHTDCDTTKLLQNDFIFYFKFSYNNS